MKNKKVYIILILIIILTVYLYNINYYKIKDPLFLKNYSYISTETDKIPLRLYYFTNNNSDFKFVDIESINNENLKIVFKGESNNRYSRYHNRHQIYLELVGLKPGEVTLNELTFIKSDGTKKIIDIGNITYKYKNKKEINKFINQRATGSSNQNKDFSIYKTEKSFFLKGINYKLPKNTLNILKVVKDNRNHLIKEGNNLNDIFEIDLKNKKYIQNQKLNYKIDKNDTLTLISFYDFEGKNQEFKKSVNINIKAEVIFENKYEKVIKEFNSEYLPYLDKDDIISLEKKLLDISNERRSFEKINSLFVDYSKYIYSWM